MAIYYAPGVYIEEPDRGTKPIEGVTTSVTAFIGYTEKAEDYIENEKPMKKSLLSTPKTITSWKQYVDHFGQYKEGAFLPYAVRGFFENGGQRCYVISVKTLGEAMRAQALVKTSHQITKQPTPYLFVRAKESGPTGENISVRIEPSKANGTDKFKLIVNGFNDTKTLDDITLSQLPHWDMSDAELRKLDQALADRREVVADNELDTVEATVRQTAKLAAEATKREEEARMVWNQMKLADKSQALQKAKDRVEAVTNELGKAQNAVQNAAKAVETASQNVETATKAYASASASLKSQTASLTSQTAEDVKTKAGDVAKATAEAEKQAQELAKATAEAQQKANELVEAKNKQNRLEKEIEAAKKTEDLAGAAKTAAETAREKTRAHDEVQRNLEAAKVEAAKAQTALEQAEAGTDQSVKTKTKNDKENADKKVAEIEARLASAKKEAEAAAEEAAKKAGISIADAEERYKKLKDEADEAKKAEREAAGKAAKMSMFDTTFNRILGRAYDADELNDTAKAQKVRQTFTTLRDLGVEIWRGVDANRPTKLNFANDTAQLKIKDDVAYNVDVDKKLLVAPDDQEALKNTKPGDRFEIVHPEQYRGYGRKGISALEELDDVNLICAPDVMNLPTESEILTVQKMMIEHCERMQFRFAILDAPRGKDVDSIKEWRMNTAGFDPQHGHAALYYPWIKIDDPLNPGQKIAIPPSGHVAGIYARSDAQRGVYKAPANETVNGVIDLEINVNQAEQGMLNPIGINCIRKFPGRGIRVWGARTLALTDPSWRYVNVRRLFNFVEASIERSTQWIVFEPNDYILWGKVRRDITAFMRTVWLSGALFGNTPDEAFYVKCDAELNPPETRDLGYLFVEIGLAPVKPAEFVVFRISQWAGPNAEA